MSYRSYGFRIGAMADLPTGFGIYGNYPSSGWPPVVRQWTIPAHEFVHGLLFLKAHTAVGHRSLLLGEFSQRGFLFYYPLVLAVKTPLPFIVFTIVGCWALARRASMPSVGWAWGVLAGAVGLLAVAMTSADQYRCAPRHRSISAARAWRRLWLGTLVQIVAVFPQCRH